MKILVWLMVLGVLMGGQVGAAPAEHDHGVAGGWQGMLTLDQGKKWATDEALRTGMEQIRTGVVKHLPALHADKLGKAGAVQVADTIDQGVDYLLKNCHLSPEADANLHVLLHRLLGAVDPLRQGDAAVRRQAMADVVDVLERYPDFFDHAGWAGLH